MSQQEEHSAFIRKSAKDYVLPISEVQKSWNLLVNEPKFLYDFYKSLEKKYTQRNQ